MMKTIKSILTYDLSPRMTMQKKIVLFTNRHFVAMAWQSAG